MRLNEISNEEKVWLKLKNIVYDFENAYDNVVTSHKFNSVPPTLIKSYIDIIQNRMNILFAEGFNKSDPDIINIKTQYMNLENIKKTL